MVLFTNMAALLLLCCCSPEVRGQIKVTQPVTVSAAVGASVTLSCQVEPEVFDNIRLAWYRQRGGRPPTPLVKLAKQRMADAPERIEGGGKNTNFSLTIRDVQEDDGAVYYCQSRHWRDRQDVFTFGDGTRLDVGRNRRPSVTVLPPSASELRWDLSSVVCVADGGFPSDWTLSWTVDGVPVDGGGDPEAVSGPGVRRGDGLYSWTSTLNMAAEQMRGVGSITCEARHASQRPVRKTLRRGTCH